MNKKKSHVQEVDAMSAKRAAKKAKKMSLADQLSDVFSVKPTEHEEDDEHNDFQTTEREDFEENADLG